MRALLAAMGGLGVAGLVVWLGSSSPAGAGGASVEAGADLAARWCAGCHVVSTSGAGQEQGPSFADIAARRNGQELRDFLSHPHARPMRGFTLTQREVEDVSAYIQTLANTDVKG